MRPYRPNQKQPDWAADREGPDAFSHDLVVVNNHDSRLRLVDELSPRRLTGYDSSM